MNEKNTNEINDLETNNADDIKGGPKKIFVGGLSVAQTALPDLEPTGDIVGGADTSTTITVTGTRIRRPN